jgi:hypothetical protein
MAIYTLYIGGKEAKFLGVFLRPIKYIIGRKENYKKGFVGSKCVSI